MISEKDYLKLIKKIPSYKTSANLTNQIFEKCGIASNCKGVNSIFSEYVYGIASVGLTAAILITGLLNWDIDGGKNVKFASNTFALADQLACGAKYILVGQK